MKKNITINLFGLLYDIDEDACKLLEQYLDNMRSYFSKREGGDEIADDIEHRVAELFSELKEQGTQAISIEHVQNIIHRIGNPEEMDSEADIASANDEASTSHAENTQSPNGSEATGTSEGTTGKRKSWLGKRKLYRDPQDQMLGGVMSGVCHYFGGTDPLPWRILMVLLALSSFSLMGIIYLLAWALVPAAKTAEERLQMKGKPVNPETINEELMNYTTKATDYIKSPSFRQGARSFASTLLSILVFCFKLLCIFLLGTILITLTILSILLMAGCVEQPLDDNWAMIIHQSPIIAWWGWGGLISGFVCFGILFYIALRSLLKTKTTHSLHSGTAITLTIICLLSLAASIVCSVMTGVNIKQAKRSIKQASGMVNGIYIEDSSANALSLEGWTIQQADNCNKDGDFMDTTDDFTMTDSKEEAFLYFQKDDESRDMKFHAVKRVVLPKGHYHVDALTSIDGTGVFMSIPSIQYTISLVSNNINRKGNLSQLEYDAAAKLKIFPDTLSNSWWLLHQREEVDKWSLTRTGSFYHQGGPLNIVIEGIQGRGADEANILLRVVNEDKKPVDNLLQRVGQ